MIRKRIEPERLYRLEARAYVAISKKQPRTWIQPEVLLAVVEELRAGRAEAAKTAPGSAE